MSDLIDTVTYTITLTSATHLMLLQQLYKGLYTYYLLVVSEILIKEEYIAVGLA
jgi:hypothetical protein